MNSSHIPLRQIGHAGSPISFTISDLTTECLNSYFHCLEDWSNEMHEAGNSKRVWFEKFKDKGLRVKIAHNEQGSAVGMIQYLPAEHSFVDGDNLYVVLCIWVHGYRQGIGDFQGSGIGSALLQAAEDDARSLGASGIAAWGLRLPFWMNASWFKRHGYRKAENAGLSQLVWKPFTPSAMPPTWIRQRKPIPRVAGKVCVVVFSNGWCPAQNVNLERARKACRQFENSVLLKVIDTSDKATLLEWGVSDGVYIDGKNVSYGPPISYEKLLNKLKNKVRKLRSCSFNY